MHVPHGREEDEPRVAGGDLVADGDVPDEDVRVVGPHVVVDPDDGGGGGGAVGEGADRADTAHAADEADAPVEVIGCSSLRGGGRELGTNKNLDL